jgi:hypothetical protein
VYICVCVCICVMSVSNANSYVHTYIYTKPTTHNTTYTTHTHIHTTLTHSHTFHTHTHHTHTHHIHTHPATALMMLFRLKKLDTAFVDGFRDVWNQDKALTDKFSKQVRVCVCEREEGVCVCM